MYPDKRDFFLGESSAAAEELLSGVSELEQRCDVVQDVTEDGTFSLSQALEIYKVKELEYAAYLLLTKSRQLENDANASQPVNVALQEVAAVFAQTTVPNLEEAKPAKHKAGSNTLIRRSRANTGHIKPTVTGYIKLQCLGGQARAIPPITTALASKGINVMEFCRQFNARTKDKKGISIPTLITVYSDRSFEFVIKTSPAPVVLTAAAHKTEKRLPPTKSAKVNQRAWVQLQKSASAQQKLSSKK